MSIKSDRWIRRMATEHEMISPFAPQQVRESVNETGEVQRAISYGVSSYGYDLRVADEFKVFTNVHGSVVDPKNFDDRSFVDIKTDCCIIPPSFALARSIEYFKIPDRSSPYALQIDLCPLDIVNVTPFEPEWEGHVTLRFQYDSTSRIGLCNEDWPLLFFESDRECETSYGDRGGKYQGQTGINPRACNPVRSG